MSDEHLIDPDCERIACDIIADDPAGYTEEERCQLRRAIAQFVVQSTSTYAQKEDQARIARRPA
jgi:hypothetical protein